MSLGDGKARSVGRTGRTVILPIADGRAMVYDVFQRTKFSDYTKPLSDYKPFCDLKMNISTTKHTDKVLMNECTFNIQNGKRDPLKFQLIQTASMSVSMGSTFFPLNINVYDASDTSNKMLKYLVKNTKSITLNVNQYKQVPVNIADGRSIATSTKQYHNKFILDRALPLTVFNRNKDEVRLNINDLYMPVENKTLASTSKTTLNIQPLFIPVEDYKPPTIGTATTGGSLKGFRLEMQKYAYMEQYLSFNDKTVADITGLPSGMVFENGYLKGSPLVSGKFNINIKMTDNTAMPGLLIVSQVPRNL
jgi:hypothetical protein